MAGILASMAAGAAEGGAGAVEKISSGKIQETIDQRKEAALFARQKSLQDIRLKYGTSERVAGQEFTADQTESERIYKEGITAEERGHEKGILGEKREYEEGVATTEHDRKMQLERLKIGGKGGETTADKKYNETQALSSIGAYIQGLGGSFDKDSRTVSINIDETGANRDEVLKYISSLGFDMFGSESKQDRPYWFTGDDKILNVNLGAYGKKGVVSSTEKPTNTFDELESQLGNIMNGGLPGYGLDEGMFKSDVFPEKEKDPRILATPKTEDSPHTGTATFDSEKPPAIDKEDTETYAKKVMREGIKGVKETGEWKGMPVGEKRGKPMVFRNGKWEYMKRNERAEYEVSKKE